MCRLFCGRGSRRLRPLREDPQNQQLESTIQFFYDQNGHITRLRLQHDRATFTHNTDISAQACTWNKRLFLWKHTRVDTGLLFEHKICCLFCSQRNFHLLSRPSSLRWIIIIVVVVVVIVIFCLLRLLTMWRGWSDCAVEIAAVCLWTKKALRRWQIWNFERWVKIWTNLCFWEKMYVLLRVECLFV